MRVRSDGARACTSAISCRSWAWCTCSGRAPAGRARRRRHGHDRRPERQDAGAAAASRRARSRRTRAAIRAQLERFLDFDGTERGAHARQRRVARAARRRRVPARRRQALHRELHAAEGLGAVAHGRGHLVHRVLVHAAAGVRLPRAAPARRRDAADRRQRSVGQHHGGHRADSPRRRRARRTR